MRVGSALDRQLERGGCNAPFNMACLEMEQDGFRVFAESKAIGSEIHAITGGLVVAQAADFNRVRQAAGGFDAEIGENRMSGVRVGDDKGFFAGALAEI